MIKNISRFALSFMLLGSLSPKVSFITGSDMNQNCSISIKVFSSAEARRGGGGMRGGFRGGGMRAGGIRSSRYQGGNFSRASRPVTSRPSRHVSKPSTRPASSKRPSNIGGRKRPASTKPVKRPSKGGASIQPVKNPVNSRPNKPGNGNKNPVSIQPTVNPVNGKPMQGHPDYNKPDRPNRPGQGDRNPVTIQPITNPVNGKPMPGHPDYKPPHNKPPHDRPDDHPYHGHPPYYYDDWDDDWYWPAVAVGAAAVGTIVATLPAECEKVVISGTTYYECDGKYYLPYYEGGVLKYKVVDNPR